AGKPSESIPQIWALYKEVQDYYDKGMRVPDDVTLLLCDDNWGNVRKLPKQDDISRSGGYGMYYHFDYVGGPRNYKWLNTVQIERVWEQMHLTYQYGVDRIWIVNVGDIKPMEFPITFFLDYAWAPDKWPAERLPEYYKLWAKQQFGDEYAEAIGDILAKYTKYNARRKPEMLSPETYSLLYYREAERIIEEYNDLVHKAKNIFENLPDNYKDAYYQMVLHPVIACANLNDLYVTVGKNRLYAEQGRAATNDLANKAKELFEKDAEISDYYNKVLAGGKWNHIMDQIHIGYTYWQQPDKNYMPEVKQIKIPKNAEMAVTIEGSSLWWPKEKKEAILPEFDPYNRQDYYIEVFNRGTEPFKYEIITETDWLQVTPREGEIKKEQRINVSINWNLASSGKYPAFINIVGPIGNQVVVKAIINNPEFPKPNQVFGFVEGNGYISIEAEHFTRAIETEAIQWLHIPNLGRTLSGITPIPVTSKSHNPVENSPHLEYQVYIFYSGEINVQAYLSPTQNFKSTEGIKYAISFDNEEPQIINIHKEDTIPDWKYPQFWEQVVGNNINISVSKHNINKPGEHVLKFWMVDPAIVLQKIVIYTNELKPSYLGPPESFYQILKSN
ncbi:MAG: glycosyl hydrolase 115 family protein, partial [Bacteroidales bacterium]|nr:glycosyl hydrolase 115 family protein [Bacteroidales bacterium]